MKNILLMVGTNRQAGKDSFLQERNRARNVYCQERREKKEIGKSRVAILNAANAFA